MDPPSSLMSFVYNELHYHTLKRTFPTTSNRKITIPSQMTILWPWRLAYELACSHQIYVQCNWPLDAGQSKRMYHRLMRPLMVF